MSTNIPFFPPAGPVPWLLKQMWRAQNVGGSAYTIIVYKAVSCPCGNTPDSPNNINCEVCNGAGVFYPYQPLQALGLVSDVQQHIELLEAGLAEQGDIVVYPDPGTVNLETFDLVKIPWQTGVPFESEIITRSSSSNSDQVSYDMREVEGAWTVNPTGGQSYFYQPNVDFTWTPGQRTITWVSKNTPAADQNYTMRYAGDFEYIAFFPPQPRIGFGQNLGQRAILRKRTIVLKNVTPFLES